MEIVNKDCIKFNFDIEGYYKIKREIIDLGKKLNEIALGYMDKYIE